jgi:hypothetical protein
MVYSTYPQFANRTSFYFYSSPLVVRGDHIRLEDIRVSYTIPRLPGWGSHFRDLDIYLYLNNLGIIWRANKDNIDPDFQQIYPAPLNFSAGIKVSIL